MQMHTYAHALAHTRTRACSHAHTCAAQEGSCKEAILTEVLAREHDVQSKFWGPRLMKRLGAEAFKRDPLQWRWVHCCLCILAGVLAMGALLLESISGCYGNGCTVFECIIGCRGIPPKHGKQEPRPLEYE